jgi:hypothetical protein
MAKTTREDFLKIEGVSQRLEQIAETNGFSVDDLLSVIEKESAFDPSNVNDSSGATGLIQFIPKTAADLGTTTNDLKGMSVLDQLEFVDKYFQKNHKKGTHPYQTVALPVSGLFEYNEPITGDSLHQKLPKTYKTVEEADAAINKWKSANPVWVNQNTNQLTPSSIVAYGGTSLNRDIVKNKQQQMKDAGFDITVDGIWGPNSRAAWTEFSDPSFKKKEKTITPQVIDPSSGEIIDQSGAGPIAGQTGRSKKEDVQVDPIEKLPVEKIDVDEKEMKLKKATPYNEVNVERKEKEKEIVEQKEEEYVTKLPTDGLKEVTIKGSSNIFNYEAKEESDFNFGNENDDDTEEKLEDKKTITFPRKLPKEVTDVVGDKKQPKKQGGEDNIDKLMLDVTETQEKIKKGEKEKAEYTYDGGSAFTNKQKFNKERLDYYTNKVLEDINEEEGTNYTSKEDYFNAVGGINSSKAIQFKNKVNKFTGEFFDSTEGPVGAKGQKFDEAYLDNIKYINTANKVFNEVITLEKGDIDGDVMKKAFAGIPNSETLDFGKFQNQMKIEILNAVPREFFGKIANGVPFKQLGLDREEIIKVAKANVIANNNLVLNKQGERLVKANKLQKNNEAAFETKRNNLRSDYEALEGQIQRINSKYGTYGWDARGREVFIPAIIDNKRATPSAEDLGILSDINATVKDLDVRQQELQQEGQALFENRKLLNEKGAAWQKRNEDMWQALGWEMSDVPLDKKPPAFQGTKAARAWDIAVKNATDNPIYATAEIAGNFTEEYARYRVLNKVLKSPQALLGLASGYLGADLIDNTVEASKAMELPTQVSKFNADGKLIYSHKDQYMDFLGSVATAKILPKNKLETLYNPNFKGSGKFWKDLTDPKAYNPSLYTVSKTFAELLPYTLNIARAGAGSAVKARAINIKNASSGRTIMNTLNKNYKVTAAEVRGINMIGMNQRMLFFDNLADARSNGLSGNSALLYANMTTLATGVSQLVMPDALFFKNDIGKNLLKTFIKDLKSVGTKQATKAINRKVYSKALKTFGQNFFKEHGEEQLDVILNDLVKANFIADYSWEVSNAQAQREIIVGTSLLTGGLGAKQARSTIKNAKTLMYEGILDQASEALQNSELEQAEIQKHINELKKEKALYVKANPKWAQVNKKIELHERRLELEKQNAQNVRNVAQALNAAPEWATIGMVDAIVEKNELIKQKKELEKKDKPSNSQEIEEINNKIKAIDNKLSQESPTEWKKSLYRMSIDRGKKLLFAAAGIELDTMELSSVEYEKEIERRNAVIKRYNRINKGKKKPIKMLNHGGVAQVIYDDLGKKPIIIFNKDAVKDADNYGVGVHEIFHLVLRQTVLKNPNAVKGLSFMLRNELLKNPNKYKFSDRFNYVGGKFKSYEEQVKSMEWDEMFTVLSEAIAQGDVKIDSNFFTRLHDVVRRSMRGSGIGFVNKNADFFSSRNPAKAMFNFIRDYNKELLGTKEEFSPGMRRIINEGLNIKPGKDFIDAARIEEAAKLAKGMIDRIWSPGGAALSTRGGRMRQKDIYQRDDVQQDIQLKENTIKIVEENERIRQQLLETRVLLEDGTYEYDEDLRNDLVLNNMALVTALSDFAAKNPKIMGLEESKRVGFEQFQSGFSRELIKLSRSYDPALTPFGAYLNMLLPLRYGDALKAEQKGAMEGSVSIDNENVGDIADDSTPNDFDNAPRFVSPKYNAAREIGRIENQDIQAEVEKLIAEGLADLKEYSSLIKNKGDSKKIAELKKKLEEKHMLDLDLDTMELSNVEGLTYKTIARLSGVDVDKLNPRSKKFLANLRKKEGKAGSNEVRSAQRFIAKHAQLILSTIFNEGHTAAFKSTNMPNVLLRFGYNKGSKRIKNNFPQYKKPNLSEKDFAEYLGIFRAKKGFDFKVDRNTSAKILAVLSLLDRTITNQSLRKSLEATGDLDERLKNALEDGLSVSAESIVFKRLSAAKQSGVEKLMPELGIAVQEIDKTLSNARTITALSKVFTKDNTLTNEEARALVTDMFKEAGVIKQYQYVKGNLESQGVKMIPFKDFAGLYLETEVYVGLIEKFGLETKVLLEDGTYEYEVPSQKEVFSTEAVKRGRNAVADFVVDNIIARWRQGDITLEEALMEIAMEEQNHVTAYKIGDGGRIFEAGTNNAVDQEASGTPRFQLFMSKEGPKADFRKFIYQFMPQDFIDALGPSAEIFRDGKTENFVEIKFEPQDGKGVITQMINVIKNVTRKGANKYDQQNKNDEADLARKLLVNKIIFFADKLSLDANFSEHDFVVQMMTLMSNPTTTLRRAGKVVGIMDGLIDENGNFLLGEISNENVRFEHQKPASYLLMKIIDIVTDEKIDPETWNDLIQKELIDYNVSIITKLADKTLDKTGVKNLMGKEYESGTEYGSMVRMFNPMNKGDKNVKAIRLIEDILAKREGLVFGLGHEIAGELLPKTVAEIEQDRKISKLTVAANSVKYNRKSRGMSTFDFDETVAISDNVIIATKDGETKRIASNEWPFVGDQLMKEGWKMDFTDFNRVTDGKPGPLMQKLKNQIKKFGPKNVFILTARAPESEGAIHAYLKSEGINLPIENITGLGNSTGEAKAVWMLNKFAEGYNDMYFVDDALPNVEAVKNVLDQLDIKSDVQIVKASQSISYDRDFNQMMEDVSGIDADKRFSTAKARRRGESKNKFKLFVPPSAEDFVGLLYQFLGKGKQGEKHFAFLKKALIEPLNRGYEALNTAKQAIATDFENLKAKMPDVKKLLYKKIPSGDYTYNDAIRVYLWNKAGFNIPGLSDADQKMLSEFVEKDAKLKAFADTLGILSRQENGYIEPTDEWLTEDIRTDLINATSRVNRKQFFTEFLENVDIIFSKENMNKIEAIYGRNFREALEDMLYRIENGTNRSFGQNALVNKFMNWINGAIGTTMFVNVRSAALQTLSMVNFINFEDNNIIAAAKAFANQKQFWSDFMMIFNSDMLKQRRAGLGLDVNASELTDYVANSTNKFKAALNFLLTKGYLPTQIADSFAIAAGGASFYRNRLNKYLKEGMNVTEAKKKAFADFRVIAEETQQSARPDMISQQQASVLGRIILAFQNTPMQYTRLMKKATLDLINGRGDAKANVSRIVYYGAVQNIIFYSLQTALFAMLFGDDEDDEEFFDKKKERVLNGTVDSVLRGMGIQGAIVSTLKNMARTFYKEQQKTFNKDESAVIMEMINLSPPLGIKLRQIRNAERTIRWNKDLMEEVPYYNLKNPVWEAGFSTVQGLTNIPLARMHQKVTNVSEAFGEDLAAWQRLALMMGWTTWNLGIEKRTSLKTGASKRKLRVGAGKMK